MPSQGKRVEEGKYVAALAPILPSSSTPDRVTMKDYHGLSITIQVDNATTVTGSAITLLQSTTVAGGGEKALAFDLVWKNEDTASSDTLVKTAVVSDTFTTIATDNLNGLYVIDVKASSLDVENGFDVVRLGTADAVATVLSAVYELYDARFSTSIAQSAITD